MKIKDMQAKPELYTTFFQDNAGELERRMNQLRLANSWKNGQVIVEYMLAGNLEVTIENVLSVVDSTYKDQLQFLAETPKQAQPEKINLGLTRKQITSLGPSQLRDIIRSSKFSKQEVLNEMNRILALPAEGDGYQLNGDDKLHALGLHRKHGHASEAPSGPSDEERKAHNLSNRQAEWDAANRKIESISVQQPGTGKHNYAASENAKTAARQKLGPRP